MQVTQFKYISESNEVPISWQDERIAPMAENTFRAPTDRVEGENSAYLAQHTMSSRPPDTDQFSSTWLMGRSDSPANQDGEMHMKYGQFFQKHGQHSVESSSNHSPLNENLAPERLPSIGAQATPHNVYDHNHHPEPIPCQRQRSEEWPPRNASLYGGPSRTIPDTFQSSPSPHSILLHQQQPHNLWLTDYRAHDVRSSAAQPTGSPDHCYNPPLDAMNLNARHHKSEEE